MTRALAILFFLQVKRWEWVHVAQTYDGNSRKLYVNGEEKSSTSLQGECSKGITRNETMY